MVVHTAHVYIASDKKDAYFEMSYDNEMSPEFIRRDDFIEEFEDKNKREDLIQESLDANVGWRDKRPYMLKDEIEESRTYDDYFYDMYNEFIKKVSKMKDIKYALFATDSNKRNWLDYPTYYYDAFIYDFDQHCLFTVKWRGNDVEKEVSIDCGDTLFTEDKSRDLVQKIKTGKFDQIEVGDFTLSDKPAGSISKRVLG